MRYMIIYDITDDEIRESIAKKLLDYGMRRVQYSSFIGEMPRFRLNSLLIDLRNILLRDDVKHGDDHVKSDERRSILVYPLCDSCYSKGLAIDRAGRNGIRYICDGKTHAGGVDVAHGQSTHDYGSDVNVI